MLALVIKIPEGFFCVSLAFFIKLDFHLVKLICNLCGEYDRILLINLANDIRAIHEDICVNDVVIFLHLTEFLLWPFKFAKINLAYDL